MYTWLPYFIISILVFANQMLGSKYMSFEIGLSLAFVFLGAKALIEKKSSLIYALVVALCVAVSLGLLGKSFDSFFYISLASLIFSNINSKNIFSWANLLSIGMVLGIFLNPALEDIYKLSAVLLICLIDFATGPDKDEARSEVFDLLVPLVIASFPIPLEWKLMAGLVLMSGIYFRTSYNILFIPLVLTMDIVPEFRLLYLFLCLMAFGGYWQHSLAFLLLIAVQCFGGSFIGAIGVSFVLLVYLAFKKTKKERPLDLASAVPAIGVLSYSVYTTKLYEDFVSSQLLVIPIVALVLVLVRHLLKKDLSHPVWNKSWTAQAVCSGTADEPLIEELDGNGFLKTEGLRGVSKDSLLIAAHILIWGAVCLFLF